MTNSVSAFQIRRQWNDIWRTFLIGLCRARKKLCFTSEERRWFDMEQPKSIEAQRGRQRGKSFDVAFIFNRCSSTEMQSRASPRESNNDLGEIRNRLRHKSWVIGGTRRSSLQTEKKRSVSSKLSFDDRRSSHPTRYNGHQFERHKTGRFVDYMKMNVPKKWLREYEKKQVSLLEKLWAQIAQRIKPCCIYGI